MHKENSASPSKFRIEFAKTFVKMCCAHIEMKEKSQELDKMNNGTKCAFAPNTKKL